MGDCIGTGEGLAAWFNPRAKQVTPKVVKGFAERLPKARLFAASTMEEAATHARQLVELAPPILFLGGGDGTVVTLLNLLRSAGAKRLPIFAFFRLGTGNGFPIEAGARSYKDTLRWLPRCPSSPPTKHYDLIDVEGRLCHFAGAGWDATVLHDYKKNLERRAQQAVASRIAATTSKGVLGYVYAILRHTVPDDARYVKEYGRTRVAIRNLGSTPMTVDKDGHTHTSKRKDGLVWRGPMGFCGAGTEPMWGGRARAFPHATLMPGKMNLRVFDRSVFQAVRYGVDFWIGRPVPGMHDFLVDHVRLEFNRPMAWQLGGDIQGVNEAIELQVSPMGLEVLDWARAHENAGPMD